MSPKEDVIKRVAFLLEEQRRIERKEENSQNYDRVKDILIYLAFFGTCVFVPGALRIFKPLIKSSQYSSWKSFNFGYLRWTLRRLSEQKIVEIVKKDGENIITITEKGQKKILKIALNDLHIQKMKKWDCQWRLVLYDISRKKRLLADKLRENLINLGFIPVQESVYIFPYPCEKEIELLRINYDLSNEIKLFTVSQIEDEDVYRTYFDLV